MDQSHPQVMHNRDLLQPAWWAAGLRVGTATDGNCLNIVSVFIPCLNGVFNNPGDTSRLQMVMDDGNFHRPKEIFLAGKGCPMGTVSFDLNHRWTFFFHHFLNDLAVGTFFDLKTAVECFHIRNFIYFALSMETVDKGLEDSKAHFA